MISSRIFQKYFLLASALLCFFVILGFVFSSFLMDAISKEHEPPPPLLVARALDRISSGDRVAALKDIVGWGADRPDTRLVLLDEDGSVLFPPDEAALPDWDRIQKPGKAYEFVQIESQNSSRPPPRLLPFLGPPRPFKMRDSLVRLEGEPAQYLLMKRSRPPQPPPEKDGRRPPIFFPLIGFGSLFLSLLLGVGVTIAIIYNGVKNGVAQADHVISELHRGNLKARFDINRKDEFGRAMLRFNTMADEIEKLVVNLKEVDQARTRLLQELAHDLRTPVASMKSLLETLQFRRADLAADVQMEMIDLALKETRYFERLVEELLFLAQIKEPSLQSQFPAVDLRSILMDTADDLLVRYEAQNKKIRYEAEFAAGVLPVKGDPHLFHRLVRNALENAFSFAGTKVRLTSKVGKNGICVIIEDDGPGFSEEALATFGTRRVTRRLESKPGGRVSLGLGSVVMRSIVEALGGRMQASNRAEGGGRLELTLPFGGTDPGHS